MNLSEPYSLLSFSFFFFVAWTFSLCQKKIKNLKLHKIPWDLDVNSLRYELEGGLLKFFESFQRKYFLKLHS